MILAGAFLTLRLAGAAVLAIAGGTKVVVPRTNVVATTSLKRVVPRAQARRVLQAFGALEMIGALFFVASPGSRLVNTAVAAAVGVGFTLLGLQSIRRTGGCGCFGAATTDKSALVVRNGLSFGAVVVGLSLGPSLTSLINQDAAVVAGLPIVLPTTALVAAVVRRVGRGEFRTLRTRMQVV